MNKVAKNAAWIIGIRVVQSIAALLINMLTARYLGPSNFGLITYASSLVAFVLPIMQLGFSNVLVQEIVNDSKAEGMVLGTSITLSLISSICCIVGVTSFAFVANPNEPTTVLICLLYSLILVFQACDHIEFWYQAKLMSKYTSIISLVAYIVVSTYKVYLLITEKSVYWFALSNALDYALISGGGIALYRKLGGQKLSFSWQLGKKMFSRSKHYIISSMMVTIFAQTDKIMIKMMMNDADTGYYGAAIACAGMTGFVFSAIIDSFRPSIFEGQKGKNSIFRHRLTMLYSIIIYLSLSQSIVMTLFSKWIVRLLYGTEYSPAISTLQIIVWYTTFSYLGSVRNIWILANGLQKHLWKINMSGAAANILLNAILIPIIGINGAAVASLITQFFTNVVIGYIIKPIRPNNKIIMESLNPKYLMDAIRKLKRHS
ncbi:MAG: flippase [Clostridia bacterium]|nr:flippase [Clostridia bacterium]